MTDTSDALQRWQSSPSAVFSMGDYGSYQRGGGGGGGCGGGGDLGGAIEMDSENCNDGTVLDRDDAATELSLPENGVGNGGGRNRNNRAIFILLAGTVAAAALYVAKRPPLPVDFISGGYDEFYELPLAPSSSDGAFSDSLPLMGKSKKAIQAQNEVRRYRKAFLDRPTLLDTEGIGGHRKGKNKKTNSNGDTIDASIGCESTVLLVRHCEKNDIREHCAYMGFERAMYLATLFGDSDEERWPAPSYVYALNPGERNDWRTRNEREVETVTPLADKFNMTVDYSYGLNEVNALSQKIFRMLRSGEMCGKLAVVSWKHGDLPRLAHHLGCGPFEGCPMDYPSLTFDDAWQIKYAYLVPWNSSQKNGKVDHKSTWKVFGNVQREGFDPLSFSKMSGDYPNGGTETAGRWMPRDLRRSEEKAITKEE